MKVSEKLKSTSSSCDQDLCNCQRLAVCLDREFALLTFTRHTFPLRLGSVSPLTGSPSQDSKLNRLVS